MSLYPGGNEFSSHVAVIYLDVFEIRGDRVADSFVKNTNSTTANQLTKGHQLYNIERIFMSSAYHSDRCILEVWLTID